MFQNIGFTELLLIAVVALVLFGPQKLPEIGRMLGKTVRDFKKAANELMQDEPKAPQASTAPIAATSPIAPDPVTPVSIAGIAVADPQGETSSEEPMAATEPTPQVQGSMNAETAVEPTSAPAVKPAVAFVTNKSSEVIQVAGSPIESAEALASSAVPSASQAAPDVLSAAPAQVSAPTPAPAQQPGSTSNSRRLPD